MTTVIWRGLEGEGSTERCRVTRGADEVVVTSVVHCPGWTCAYRLRADAGWRFERLDVVVGERTLEVTRSAEGWQVDGRDRPDLADALEVDVAVAPLSNTLPVRRLALGLGEGADIVTAYVTVPDLQVVSDPQRYTRTGPREYLYESRDSDFHRSVTVDGEGLVVSYPGLFERADDPA